VGHRRIDRGGAIALACEARLLHRADRLAEFPRRDRGHCKSVQRLQDMTSRPRSRRSGLDALRDGRTPRWAPVGLAARRYLRAVHAAFRQGLTGLGIRRSRRGDELLPNAELLIDDAPMSSSLDDLRAPFALGA
jgi:hypothetical protein